MRAIIGCCLMLGLAACGTMGGDVSVEKGLTTRYTDTDEVKTMSAEKLASDSRGAALGVQANLTGPVDTVRQKLDGAVLLIGPVPAPEAERYVGHIRDTLLARWPWGPIVAPRVEIVASRQYNAESLSDDTLQISYGVLARATSEDEVAFVVGHELGHLYLQHQIRRRQTLNDTRNAVQIAGGLALLGVAVGTGKTVGTTTVIQAGPTLGAAAGAAGADITAAEVIQTLIDPGWSSRQEEQADLIGVDLMAAAGYSPAVTTTVFDRIAEDEAAAAKIAEAYKQKVAEERKNASAPANVGAFFQQISDSVTSELDQLRTNHPDTKKREAALSDYRDKYYAAQLASPPKADSLKALHASRPFQHLSQAIDEAMRADEELHQGDNAGALKAATAAQGLARSWWAPPYLAGLALLGENRTRQGIDALLASTRLEGAPFPAFERAAFELAKSREFAASIKVMDDADRRFSDGELTLPDRIILYRYAGNQAAVAETGKRCSSSKDPKLRDACNAATTRPLDQPGHTGV